MNIKSLAIKELNKSIDAKTISVQEMLQATIDSRDSDNKSSAGDKHETSRAKIQIEIDHLYKHVFVHKNLEPIPNNRDISHFILHQSDREYMLNYDVTG